MTTKPKASRYNIRRRKDAAPAQSAAAPQPQEGVVDSPAQVSAEATLDGIRKEGLTGRQLRMARRMAQKHGLAVTSDFDAVRQLREQGIDPFKRANVLDMVVPKEGAQTPPQQPAPQSQPPAQGVQLPQVAQTTQVAPAMPPRAGLEQRASEIRKMQRDIARRRRRNIFLLAARLMFFIGLPTLIAGVYFYTIATPMYATKSEFVIQQASSGGRSAGGLGSLFQGTSMATQQDSIAVQSYLSSEAAMRRLDEDHGFRAAFTNPDIDALQRIEAGASNAEAYSVYKKRIKISYDPTEGLVRMEVSAPSPELAVEFNQALIGYAEDQVDQMTARLRRDQMQGALANYETTEAARKEALRELTQVQAAAEVLDPQSENAALMSRIGSMEAQRDELTLELATLLDNARPNQARVDGVKASISRIDEQISQLRRQITEATDGRQAQTETAARLREAEENYQVRLTLVQEALAQMETARIEANRQVRYLSLSVPPTPPDAAAYPKGFENTALAFLIFAGVFMIMSLTAAVLKEQVSS